MKWLYRIFRLFFCPHLFRSRAEEFFGRQDWRYRKLPYGFHCTGDRDCACPICQAAQRILGRKKRPVFVPAPEVPGSMPEPYLPCPTCAVGRYSPDQVAACADRYRQRTF